MSLSSIKKVYDTYAWFYDVAFGRIFQQGRYFTTNIVNQNAKKGARILELGVGTGLSLPLYRDDLEIVGIDISDKMLNKAKERIAAKQLKTNISLHVMDAENLSFDNDSFDFVVAMYVASVVPDIKAFLQEITRVCKPSSDILFVNHFASEKPTLNFLEKKLESLNHLIGFNSNFSIESILSYKQLELIDSHKINLFGYWKVLHCKCC